MNLITVDLAKKKIAEGARVIDTRPSAIFVQGLIPHSMFIPDTPDFLEYAALILEPDMPLLLLAGPGQQETVSRRLLKTGFANVIGILDGGYEAWVEAGGAKDLIIDITPEEFELDFNFDEFYLIDLRTEDQYEEEHFEYAENLPLSELEEAIPDLNPDVTYYLYGNSFDDAAFAGALFRSSGFHKLRVVNEGYEALKSTNIPVIKKKKPKPDPNFSAN